MLLIIVIAVGCVALCVLPMMLVDAVATIMMVGQVLSSDRICRALIEGRHDNARVADWDRRPTAAERKLLRRGLRLAIQQTDASSLLPHVALRARRIAAALSRGTS
ncbi:hypothetical protein BH10PSE14_BH10PSE14_35270 [soil metagenome]